MPKPEPSDANIPLVVDFDGTMHLRDLTLVGLWWVLKTRPWKLPRLLWLHATRGRAAMKLALEALTERYDWVPVLPWEERVLERIAAEKAQGRTVVVVTGSTTRLVKRIVEGQGLDYEVVGTEDAAINLTGPRKAAALVKRWGVKKFDYIGNSKDDLYVWREARYALVVNARKKVGAAALAHGNVNWHLEKLPRKSLRTRR